MKSGFSCRTTWSKLLRFTPSILDGLGLEESEREGAGVVSGVAVFTQPHAAEKRKMAMTAIVNTYIAVRGFVAVKECTPEQGVYKDIKN